MTGTDTATQKLIGLSTYLADNPLILAQRNSEWCGHGPVLEQDIAITNISLDLIGQARNFYQYAATLINQSGLQPGQIATEDTLAYLRDSHEFKNVVLVELPKGDWAVTILRQFFFSAYQYYLYNQLRDSSDTQLAAIAAKSLKEVVYHLRWSSEWVIRLGDGTEESHKRITDAATYLWDYTHELFLPAEFENTSNGIDLAAIKQQWDEKVSDIFREATLQVPTTAKNVSGGKQGTNHPYLESILGELQYMQRTYPGCEW